MNRVSGPAVAVAAVGVSTAIGFGLDALIPSAALGFLLFVPPILVAALYGGYGPAVLATILGSVSAEFFFNRPYFTLHWAGEEAYPLMLYLLIGLGVAVLAGRLARASADVQRREREFDTLFRLTPVGIGVAADPACRDIQVNPALAAMLRVGHGANGSLSATTPDQRPNITVLRDGQHVPPEDLPLQKAARLGIEIKNVELQVIHADGGVLNLYEFAAPLFDDEGRVRGAIGAFVDITELKRAEERLRRLADENEQLYREAREANRLKDEFLATLSHELRTPLNALLGWLQLLRSGQLTPEKRERALAAVERSAQLQAQLTSDLLDVSGVMTGKLRLRPEPTHIPPLVDDVLESLRAAAQARGVSCTHRVAVDAPLVLDPTRVQQMLSNLVANAVKFTPRDGRIDIRVTLEDDDLVMQVQDTGIGVPHEFLPHLFERFRQADAGTTRPYGGLGLGLSIVKELAERHGGSVMAESPGPGLGATFTVRLPARRAAAGSGTAGGTRQHVAW